MIVKVKARIDTISATSENVGFFTFIPPFLYFVHSYNSTQYNLCQWLFLYNVQFLSLTFMIVTCIIKLKGGVNMKERLKEIRKSNPNGKTQETFANYLGISKENISSYESGRRNPSDSFIKLVCEKCNVNEEWLRTGNGEMFIPKSKEQLFSELLGEAVKADENDFKRRLFLALSKLDDSGWESLEKLIDSIAKKEE